MHCRNLVLCVSKIWIHQFPLSVGFSRQEHWSGLPCPSPGDLPNAEIKPVSLTSCALASWFFTTSGHLDGPRFG